MIEFNRKRPPETMCEDIGEPLRPRPPLSQHFGKVMVGALAGPEPVMPGFDESVVETIETSNEDSLAVAAAHKAAQSRHEQAANLTRYVSPYKRNLFIGQ
jgi:hypothetical protein